MDAEIIFETLGFFQQLTRYIDRGGFIEMCSREKFKSYGLPFFLMCKEQFFLSLGPFFDL